MKPICLMLLLMEATRRVMGLALPITALLLATGVPIALALRRRRVGTGRSHKA